MSEEEIAAFEAKNEDISSDLEGHTTSLVAEMLEIVEENYKIRNARVASEYRAPAPAPHASVVRQEDLNKDRKIYVPTEEELATFEWACQINNEGTHKDKERRGGTHLVHQGLRARFQGTANLDTLDGEEVTRRIRKVLDGRS
jgi:hypothetical protein